jgi:predicted amidophosphoribosyltransferase
MPGSPGYDDRMTQVARAIGAGVDVREVIYTTVEREAMHANQNARDPDALRATLGIRPELLNPSPAQVILLDDVLTTGCSFRVSKAMLAEVWPAAQIYGIFVARRITERLSLFDDVADASDN